MRRALTSRAACAAALAGAIAAACGARTGLVVPEASEAAGDASADACAGREIPIDANAPNLYFVLDRSGSMMEQSKWANVRAVVADLVSQLGSRARFGAAVFPAPFGDACAAGLEVMPPTPGDSQGQAAARFSAATAMDPKGGTPTAATLEALAPELRSFRQVTFAILATDGGPNCNAGLSCGIDQCTVNIDGVGGCLPSTPPNCCDPSGGAGPQGCLDGARTIQAVSDLRAVGVETFVIGIPGSAPYAALLDQLAVAGGTPRTSEPRYYRVDTADSSALAGVLAQIAAKTTASCAFHLSRAPGDPNAVNVYVGGALVAQGGADGWTIAGAELTLEGATCDALLQGRVVSVRVVEGCPTVR